MESIKIIEAIIIAAFIFPALSVLIIILLVIFTHIYFHRSNLASSFYEQATRASLVLSATKSTPSASLSPIALFSFIFIVGFTVFDYSSNYNFPHLDRREK